MVPWANWFWRFVVCFSLPTILCYNIDTSAPTVFGIDQNDYKGKATDVNESYFGFSLEFYKENQRTWLLVGAPRANPSALLQRKPEPRTPGGAFYCNVSGIPLGAKKSLCKELPLDDPAASDIVTGSDSKYKFFYMSERFLGGSIAVPHKSEDAPFVVCGHKWTFLDTNDIQRANDSDMAGACVLMRSLNDKGSRILPTKNWNQVDVHGAAGLAVKYSKDDDRILFGIPGSSAIIGINKEPTHDGFPHEQCCKYHFHQLTAAGYDVSSGYFRGRILRYAISQPIGSKVILKSKIKTEFVKQADADPQGFTGFGMKLCACDVNGDGQDELLVGAPLYKSPSGEKGEEGAVFVYKSSLVDGNAEYRLVARLLGEQPRARFGQSIVCAGDVNSDGYNDVLIGAPYEHKNSGAVYIYNGGKKGVSPTHSQRLSPADPPLLANGIMGFGFAISAVSDLKLDVWKDLPLDIETSKKHIYGVAVGAFMSSDAVLYLTRPVIHLQTTLKVQEVISLHHFMSNEPVASLNVTCFFNKAALPKIGVVFTVMPDANSTQKRLRLKADEKLDASVQETDRLLDNIMSPMLISVEVRIAESSTKNGPKPILSPEARKPRTVQTRFEPSCKNDSGCQRDLAIEISTFRNDNGYNYIIMGDTRQHTLEVQIINSNDTVYGVQVFVQLPTGCQYLFAQSRHETSCTSVAGNVTCDLGFSVDAEQTITVVFHLGMNEIRQDAKFHVEVTSIFPETSRTTEDNEDSITVPTLIESNLIVNCMFEKSEIAIDLKQDTKDLVLTLSMNVENQGLGLVPMTTLNIKMAEEHQVLSFTNKRSFPAGHCNDTEYTLPNTIEKKHGCMGTEGGTCYHSACRHGNLLPDGLIKHELTIMVSYEAFAAILKLRRVLNISAEVWVYGAEGWSRNVTLVAYGNSMAFTTIKLIEQPTADNLIWYIVGAAIGAFLFLIIVIIILYKVGFFRRKKYEKLHRMRQSLKVAGQKLVTEAKEGDTNNRDNDAFSASETQAQDNMVEQSRDAQML